MTAFYCITSTTDLVRYFDGQAQEPIIKHIERELCSDMEDFRFGALIRFSGIKERYPLATLHECERGAYVLVDGVEVYRTEVLMVEPTPIEVPEED